jgi:DNA-binding LacI/PurR family transcriptional regulator
MGRKPEANDVNTVDTRERERRTSRRPHGAPPTLDEVARMAAVSTATASRVINGTAKVNPKTRRVVEDAIERLGYVPNHAARSLATRRTNTIALVVSESESRVFSDLYFRMMVQQIAAVIADTELQLLLLLASGEREHHKVERYLRQGHVDGVILVSLHGEDPLPNALTAAGIPTILSGRPRPDQHLPFVDADNRGGAHAATRHLLEQGRTRVATITGPLDMMVAVDRFDGYKDALRDVGHRERKNLIAHGDFTEEGGERAMRSLLRRNPAIDAVFVASDAMALGALRALDASGRRVPDDVAVVGFDDIGVAATATPPLTTVRQPLTEMTRVMTGLLLKAIEGEASPDESVICPTRLIRRASA